MLSFAKASRSTMPQTSALRRSAPPSATHALSRSAGRSASSCACGGGCPRCKGDALTQSKLTISQPGDPHEREADRVAGEVMQMRESVAPIKAGPGPAVQRRANEQGPPNVAPPIVHEVLSSPAKPLDAATRAFMEPRFGHDFSQVRVHADARAAESARSVGALAYTVDRHLVFGDGQYVPGSPRGRHLLAHELAHVVQQGPAQPQLMRTISYDADCDADHGDVSGNVSSAQSSAARWAVAASLALARPEEVGSLLRRHFNVAATDSASITRIRNAFDSAAGLLDADAFTYHCRPSSDQRCSLPHGPYAAFAYPGVHDIYFCDPYPHQNFFGHKGLIDTLLHEAMHAHDPAFNHDTYESNQSYPGGAPLTNADSYASFARDVALGFEGPNLELSVGGLMSADPQFYLAAGISSEFGGPAFDLFNLKAGLRVAYMPRAQGQPARVLPTVADIGLRINPIGSRIYVDVTTGAFYGVNINDATLMAGIANRVSAGYRGERVDLGLDVSHFHDYVGDQNLLIIGVRGAIRFH
jgi:hypothetical protein